MKDSKLWITVNSLLAFISAFLFAKMVLGFARFVVMRFFEGCVVMRNFEILCVTWKYSPIWTYKSVISIYLTGFIAAIVLLIISYLLFLKYKKIRGFIKLWIIWLQVILINQSVGLFLRDVPFKRDLFHALEWMHIPYNVMIFITILSIPILIVFNLYNHTKFLRMTPAYDYILSNKRQRNLYTLLAFIPAVLGSFFLLILNGFKFQLFELVELSILIISIGFSYFLMLNEELTIEIRIVKNEPSNRFSLFVFSGFAIILAAFYFYNSFF